MFKSGKRQWVRHVARIKMSNEYNILVRTIEGKRALGRDVGVEKWEVTVIVYGVVSPKASHTLLILLIYCASSPEF
jgi:ribosomal protein L7Ae-like RNA K-turn-binding protein